MFEIVIFIGFSILCEYAGMGRAANANCPMYEDKSADLSNFIHSVAGTSFTPTYDINDFKYYVMTPSSYPNFINPNGEDYAWEGSECAGKDILFNCHGWRTTGTEELTYDLLGTFVKQYGGCGVASDYSEAVLNFDYIAVVRETPNIATGLSTYINNHICPYVNCSKKFQLHGHSLGAHTCGVTGYFLKQEGIVVPRMLASDAAGPHYNELDVNNATLHLSKESAATVINVRTTKLLGSSLAEWVHQQQHVGPCVLPQNQCSIISRQESCGHGLSVYMMRSTMEKDFPDVRLKQIESKKPYNCLSPTYIKPAVEDSLGWKSKGIPGEFKIGPLDVCLDLSHVAQI